MNVNRVIVKWYCIGGYKGMTELYGRRITPYFNTSSQADQYRSFYRGFSESLSTGSTVKEEFFM